MDPKFLVEILHVSKDKIISCKLNLVIAIQLPASSTACVSNNTDIDIKPR